jgi:hypothetical protein
MMAAAYRKYWNAYRAFHRLFPWLWFAGMGLCLLVAVLGLGPQWLAIVCAVTVYPAIIGWLGFNGTRVFVSLLPRVRRRRLVGRAVPSLLLLMFLVLGAVFTARAIGLLWAILVGWSVHPVEGPFDGR